MREQEQPSRTGGFRPTRRQVLVGAAVATLGITAAELTRRRFFNQESEHVAGLWQFASIDTMKQSRDGARDPRITPQFIRNEIRVIKELGATHVAIGTPYDEEFLPLLGAWVNETRQQGLKVWFRGNFCAFERQYGIDEGWFGYPHEPDETKHHRRTYDYITTHPDLFQKGDIFTPWPEPENVINFYDNPQRHYDFLTTSYQTTKQAFQDIKKHNDISINFSMNGDVARRLTPEVVQAIGNTVVIDHYVDDPQKMSEYMQTIIDLYGDDVRLVLGEFGAGEQMTELEQAQFVEKLLLEIEKFPDNVQGVNYWVILGGSTGLLTEEGNPKQVTEVIKRYYAKHTKPTG